MKASAARLLLALAAAACRPDAPKPPPPRYLASLDTSPAVGFADSATAEPVVAVAGSRRPEPSPEPRCDPNYTPCVPVDSDVDCGGGRGNGPSYVWTPVTVVGTDVYGLDRDGDGMGCDQ